MFDSADANDLTFVSSKTGTFSIPSRPLGSVSRISLLKPSTILATN